MPPIIKGIFAARTTAATSRAFATPAFISLTLTTCGGPSQRVATSASAAVTTLSSTATRQIREPQVDRYDVCDLLRTPCDPERFS